MPAPNPLTQEINELLSEHGIVPGDEPLLVHGIRELVKRHQAEAWDKNSHMVETLLKGRANPYVPRETTGLPVGIGGITCTNGCG